MPKQTHALWLANALESWTLGGKADTQVKAAAELRRLNAVENQREELLERLEELLEYSENLRGSGVYNRARAAIAKAEGKV